jgi:hypothetical protein
MRSARVAGIGLTVLLFAACGGADGDDGAEVSESAGNAVAEAIVGSNCVEAAAAFNAVSQAVLMGMMDPSSLDVDEIRSNVEKAQAAVPAEIAADFALFSEAYVKVGQALVQAGENGGFTNPANAELFEQLSSDLEDAELQAAGERVGAFFLAECNAG